MTDGMKVGELYIDLRLNKDPLERGMKQVQGQLQGMSRAWGQQGMRGLDEGTRSWTTSLSRAGEQLFYLARGASTVYGTFERVFSTANEWGQIGLQAMKSRYALEQLTGSAGAAKGYITAVTDALHGTVTAGEAAAQAYQLIRFGLADSAESAAAFARNVAIVAQANPQLGGTANAIQQIQLTLANQSYMRLDQLGLSAGAVKERVQELQAATKGLSSEQAFQQAVMEGLAEQANMLGDEFLAMGSNQEQLKAKFRGFKETIGKEITEGFEGAAGALLSVGEIWDHLKSDPVVTLKVIVEETVKAAAGIEEGPDQLFHGPTESPLKGGDRQRFSRTAYGVYPGTLMQNNDFSYATMQHGMLESLGKYYGYRAEGEKLGTFDAGYISDLYPYGFQPAGDYWEQYYAAQQRARMSPEDYRNWLVYGSDSPRRGGGGGGGGGSGSGRAPIDWNAINRTRTERGLTEQYGGLSTPWMRSYTEPQGTAPWMLSPGYMEGGRRSSYTYGAPVFDTNATTAIPDMLQKGTDFARQFAGALSGATQEISNMAAAADAVSFDSLAEKFGTDQASAFNVDVFGEMQAALQDAEVAGNVAADAMLRYKLETGMATGSSEVFAGQMETLANKLKDGKISSEEYVDAVSELSRMDFSNLDATVAGLISQGDVDMAERYINAMSQVSNLALATGPAAQVMGNGARFDEGGMQTGGDAAAVESTATPVSPLLADLEAARDSTQRLKDDMDYAFATSYTIPVTLDVIAPRTVEFTVSPMVTGGAASGGKGAAIPAGPGGAAMAEFDDGGWTGSGSPTDVAGVVHGQEWVIPTAGGPVIREGNGGNGRPIQIQLIESGRVRYESTIREDRRRNRHNQTREL